jgi:hypothetical protein
MSSTGQATSSTSNFQLIINALADYTKITGIDLSKSPFAAALKQPTSHEAILELLQGREKAFKEYRDGNRRLINFLSPAVKVLQAFSGIFSGPVSLVSHTSSGEPFNVTSESSGSLPTSKCFVCWVRCPPCCTSVCFSNSSLVMYEYARLQVGFRRATMPYSTCLSA